MASFSAGTTFTDGVANDVTAAKLAALVNAATPTSGFIQDRTAESTIAADDTLLFGDFSDSSNLKRMTVANFAGTLPTATITTLNSTTGTIATLNSTTPTFLGAITASTNTINVGSGQIFKDATGNVGVGTSSPATKLSVVASANSGINVTNGTMTGIFFNSSDTLIAIGSTSNHPVAFLTNNAESLRIDTSGGVTIAGLAGSGSRAVNASATGLLSAASDASLKEEVVGAHIAGLAEILQIHPKMYRWKDDIANRGENASVELGFIANDVAPIIPSAAPLGNDGLYGFYDRSITAALVKAVQELKSENDSLKSRIEALESK